MKYYLKEDGKPRYGLIAQLCQLTTLTWDGDLISKDHRNKLYEKGYSSKNNGYNIITPEGLKVLSDLEIIKY